MGNENYLPAQEITQNITIEKKSQTINLSGPGDQFVSQPFVPISATASSGLPVSLATADTANCTADGHVVNITGSGPCAISIIQPGNENYQAASAVKSIIQPVKADQVISFDPINPTVFGGPDIALNAIASSGLAVRFTASGTCSVAGWRVSITAAGSCTITAHQDGDDRYNSAEPVSQSFTIAKATPIIFWQNPDEIMLGTPLGPSQLFASAATVDWIDGNPYASVPGTYTYTPGFGTVLPAGIHPLHVVFTPTDNDNYTGNEKTVEILVVTSHEDE